MAVIDTRPSEFGSAYRPLVYEVTTDRFPNTRAQESGSISTFTEVDATDVGNFPEFVIGELKMVPTAPLNIATHFKKGQHVKIFDTDNGLYQGIVKIKKVGSSSAFVLDTAYIGDETGGDIDKF